MRDGIRRLRNQLASPKSPDNKQSVRPVGELVLPPIREPPQVGPVIVDGIDLDGPREVRGEDDVPSVGRPGRRFIAGVRLRQLCRLIGPEVQDIEVEDTVDTPDIGDSVARRGPGRGIVVVSAEAHLAEVRALRVHDVNLGRALAPLAWKRAHYALAARAGLPEDRRLSIHAWRHSCAVHLLMNGADVKLVKDWLGHAELENTLAYTDLAPGHWTEFSQEALRRFRF